ncbi:hypothetical protein I5907_16955 [Panacibacter sp. DH6]|uniref:Uncharacterized protein n=1 Tax=Panacibacter microcysteis TaxID=2793269 RepID=A0A931MC65_9BACT|nr:hypothetical protein [Panacibacter microcysteis]MBG9377931.1 hypothetical protein [Panacibacter microcysteis]
MENISIHIDLKSDKQARLHIKLYETEIANLQDKVNDLNKQLEETSSEIEQYRTLIYDINKQLKYAGTGKTISDYVKISPKENEYSDKWPLFKKCEYILNNSSTLLTTRELAERIFEIENWFDEKNESVIDPLHKNIGATLYQKLQKNEIFYRENINGEYKYGLLEKVVKEPESEEELDLPF